MDKIEYDYCSGHHCHHGDPLEKYRDSFNNSTGPNKSYFNMLLKYIRDTLVNYDSAIGKRIKAIEKGFQSLGENPSMQQVVDNILFNLLKDWDKDFIRIQRKTTNDAVDVIYRFFRADRSIFTSNIEDVADAIFDTIDLRTLEYFKNSDGFYLGKFITDEDTVRRISKFIESEYIENNIPIGSNKDPETLKRFRNQFAGVLVGEEWKITRIISTTVNRLRAYGALNYMNQAEIEEFEIRGINDRLQCPYCKRMQGRRFKINTAFTKMDQVVRSNPEIIGIDSPFITSLYKDPEELDNLSDEDLQQAGIDLPPFHPHCRDRIVAVFDSRGTDVRPPSQSSRIFDNFESLSQESKDKINKAYSDNIENIENNFGADIDRNSFFNLVGGFANSSEVNRVKIRYVESKSLYKVIVEADDYEYERIIHLSDLFIENQILKVNKTGNRLGTKILKNQVVTARRLGFDRIQAFADGNPSSKVFNGYYTWPRLGFKEDLNESRFIIEDIRELLTNNPLDSVEDINDIKSIHDLIYGHEGGSKWWKENGKAFGVFFDLDINSSSSIILDNYTKDLK